MKMYAIMIVGSIIWGYHAHSQDNANDLDDCTKYRSVYYNDLKLGDYTSARTYWLKSIEACGGVDSMDYKFYRNGRLIYNKLSNLFSTDDSLRIELHRDSICWIYEQGLKFTSDSSWRLEYGQYLVYRKDPRTAKIDSLFAGIENMHFSLHPKFIRYYYKHLIRNHFNKAPSGQKQAAIELIVSKFFPLSEMCIRAIVEYQVSDIPLKEEYEKAFLLLDTYFLLIFPDPEALLHVMDEEYVNLNLAKAIRKEEIKHALSLMDAKNCPKTKTYIKYVRELIKIDSSAAAYENLGKLEATIGNYENAIIAYRKAIALDSKSKDENYYQIASIQFLSKQYRQAFYTAKKVNGVLKGKAAIICGDCVARRSQKCGDSSFERDANYWLANDYYVLAHKLGEKVNRNEYMNRAPDQDAFFVEGYLEKDMFLCNCWSEKTEVRIHNSDG
jgi:tetratricopeptide (TPR) repeat protein